MHTRNTIGRLLGDVHRSTRLHFAATLGPLGLPETTLVYYMTLLERDGIRQDELTELCHRDPVTTSRALARMEDAGLVVRHVPDDDKRAKSVSLTSRARKRAPQVRRILGDWIGTITAGLTDREVAVLEDVLSRMAENAARAVRERRQGDESGGGEG